jgi:hypothetical protein
VRDTQGRRRGLYRVFLLVATLLVELTFCSSVLINLGKSAGATTLSLIPQTINATTGQNFSLNITISDVADLYGWEFTLNWTSPLLSTMSVVEGSFLGAGGNTFFTYAFNDTTGGIIVDDTLIGEVSGVSGSGLLATVTFNIAAAGQTPLNLTEATLLDPNSVQIPCEVVNGYGYFSTPHDVAITDVQASPTTTMIGSMVNVNVTTQDLGNYDETYNVTAYANSAAIGVQSVTLTSGSSTALTFTWTTSTFKQGDYVISAFASVVQGEANTTNNYMRMTSPVTLLLNGHDVATTSIQASRTIVGRGYSALISASVKNFGVFTETFDSTVYINGSVVDVQAVTLDSGMSAVVSYNWSTIGLVYGNYTLSAYASPVSGENDTTNNFLVSLTAVHVGVPGDVSSSTAGVYDGTVNMRDVAYLVIQFGTKPPSANWNPNADVNGDAVVNLRDIAIAVQFFTKHE